MYQQFATLYDSFMHERMNYYSWACFIENIFQWCEITKKDHIADVGCGTGSFLKHIKRFGYRHFTAIDQSAEMLLHLQEKFKGSETVRVLTMDMRHWSEPETHQAITALFDVVNYLKEEELLSFFKQMYENLTPGGVFIFDGLSEEVIQDIFPTQQVTTSLEQGEVTWRLEREGRRLEVETITTIGGQRHHERHLKYLYEGKLLRSLLQRVGFSVTQVREPSVAPHREFFIARKET